MSEFEKALVALIVFLPVAGGLVAAVALICMSAGTIDAEAQDEEPTP